MRIGSPLAIGMVFLLLSWSCSRKKQPDQLSETNDSIPMVHTIKVSWMDMGYPQQPPKWHSLSAFDTISLGNDLLSFRGAQATFSPYYPDHNKRDSIRHHFDNDFQASLAVERYLEQAYDTLFRRLSDTLRFTASDQDHWQLINSDSQRYCVEHYFEAQRLFLVKIFYQIGNSYTLINAHNGQVVYLWGRPYFSPEGRSLVSINNDQKIQYGANGIQFFDMAGDSLVQRWELGLSNWGPRALSWLAEDSLIIQREYPAPNESEEVYISDEVLLVLSSKDPAIL